MYLPADQLGVLGTGQETSGVQGPKVGPVEKTIINLDTNQFIKNIVKRIALSLERQRSFSFTIEKEKQQTFSLAPISTVATEQGDFMFEVCILFLCLRGTSHGSTHSQKIGMKGDLGDGSNCPQVYIQV